MQRRQVWIQGEKKIRGCQGRTDRFHIFWVEVSVVTSSCDIWIEFAAGEGVIS